VRPYERFHWRGVTEITQIGPAERHPQKSVQSVTRRLSTPEEAAARASSQLDRGTDGVKIFAGAIVGGTIGVLPMQIDIAEHR
jgi:hypothetical protein